MISSLILRSLIFCAHFVCILCDTNYLTYHNVFFDPSFIVDQQYDNSTLPAQTSIIQWANILAEQGPWAVVDKSFVPKDADIHDFASFAPYSWPNCSTIHNKTELSPQTVWFRCPYDQRDGQFNPDYLAVNNSGAFNAMTDAVLYNTLAWGITGSKNYSNTAIHLIDTWFLDPQTSMNPNMDYAQLLRGPSGQKGSSFGVLQLRMSCKIVTSILLLRKGNNPDWTADLDSGMREWSAKYIHWLMNSDTAIGAKNIPNNHATFYFNQLAAFQILVDDFAAARDSLKEYFTGVFLEQIRGNGEQPREAARTLPYHYRSFGVLGSSINARLAQYVGYDDAWTTNSTRGGTIQKALDYILTLNPPPLQSETDAVHTDPPTLDLYPTIAMITQKFGDPTGQYTSFLERSHAPKYWEQPWAFWEQISAPSDTSNIDNLDNGVLVELPCTRRIAVIVILLGGLLL